MTWWIWAAALAAYAAFLAWYRNWRPPLRPDEIEAFLAAIRGTPSAEHNDLDVLRDFLSRDDGREFLMLNLVRVEQEPVVHPATGVMTTGRELMQEYTKAFLPALLRRGGHPAIVSRKVGGYVDAWHVPADPGWTIMGYVRYRSRRDLMELVSDPRFLAAHPLKIAATPETFSFPTQPMLRLYPSPSIWVGLLLALLAALGQIAVLPG
ncbi:MAG TPA: hypothetical protein VEC57_16970 [Candidatus Limnocylindrales bacterium]|nr:hypothetical protein [Candidatus Limnocylindrales bacterium]